MSYFTSVSLSLNSSEDIFLQSFSGFASRGLFYNIIRSVDEELASLVHAGKGLAPFSCSPVYSFNGERRVPCFSKISRGLLEVYFTVFDEKLINTLIGFIQGKLGGGEISLGRGVAKLNSIFFTEIFYEKLYESAEPVESFKINFITPTYFRSSPIEFNEDSSRISDKKAFTPYKFIVFPDPVLMFKSIIRVWRFFSDYKIDFKDFINWLESGSVVVSGYPQGIKTRIVYEHPTTNKWCVGFTGEVYFTIIKELYDIEMSRLVDMLLKFAEYSNVGGGKTAGLGVIKYSPKSLTELTDRNSDHTELG